MKMIMFDDDVVTVVKLVVFLTTLEHTSPNEEPTNEFQ